MDGFNEKEFTKKYRGTEQFVSSDNEYYKMFLDLLKDDALLDRIRFCNDYLSVPPIKTFVLYMRAVMNDAVFDRIMQPFEKKGLGACFGYLYKFIYGGYESQQCWFNDKPTGITTASCFLRK